MDWILREIAYVPLNGRIRSKRSSCMQPSIFWEKKMSTRHAYQWSNGFEVLDVLPRGLWIWNLDVLPRGSMDLKFGRAFKRSNGLILDVLPRGPLKLNLDVLLRGPLKLNLDMLPRGPLKLNFGRASQRSDGLKFGRASQRSDDLKFGRAS